MTEKRCPRCEQTLDVSCFHKNKARHDGLESMCKGCKNKAFRDKYKDNEEFRASTKNRTREYHIANPEWSRERVRESHVRNRDKRYKKQRDRIANDPSIKSRVRDASRRSESRRRAIKASAVVSIVTAKDLQDLLNLYNNKCYICEVDLDESNLHWDHYQPLARQGEHTTHNLRPACNMCNTRKNAIWPITEAILLDIKETVQAVRNSLTHSQTGGDA